MLRLQSAHDGTSRLYSLSMSTGNQIGGIAHYLALTDIEAGLNAAEAQALRDVLHILSHEIMNSLTPITSLSSSAEDLLLEPYSLENQEMISEAVSTIKRRAEGLDCFVQGYRNLAKLPAPNMQPLDLVQLVNEAQKIFNARWEDKVSLSSVISDRSVNLRADQSQLEQALMNILNNAAEAALFNENPKVEVSITANKSHAIIYIKDNGSGIDKNNIQKIFQPFITFKNSGNGIGLTLSRQIILGHGGSINVKSGSNLGNWKTIFEIIL
ncbi:signal transduction histidine kinase [Neokomagataea thailandica NBRC 106555]|nr:signal transduction histidine kinase [Neokomagataea thailandica NBRC 106555]